MKLGLIITASFATGGIASTATLSNSSTTFDQNLNASSKKEDQNISVKNILQIQKEIEESKKNNTIPDLVKETISRIVKADTSFNESYSAEIYVNLVQDQSKISLSISGIENAHKSLQDLLKEQIKLAKEKDVYKSIQTHFATTAPTTTDWEVVTKNSNCEIQKKSTTAVSVPPITPTYDVCSAEWQILLISLEEKIKQLLVEKTTLLDEFKKIIS